MTTALPAITVITICYNADSYLEKTILSVINQKFKNYEYVIIDGGSTDGTLDIIKKYEGQITFWLSERDKGISDAFNKGIKHAKDSHLVMLNGGDSFISPNVLTTVSKCLDESIVSFRYRQEDSPFTSRHIDPNSPIMLRSLVGHQTTFVHKRVYDELGGYGLSYKVRMDYDFFLRAFNYYKLSFYDDVIVSYNAGQSADIKLKVRYECEGIVAEYLNLRKPSAYLFKILHVPAYRIAREQLSKVYHKLKGRPNEGSN